MDALLRPRDGGECLGQCWNGNGRYKAMKAVCAKLTRETHQGSEMSRAPQKLKFLETGPRSFQIPYGYTEQTLVIQTPHGVLQTPRGYREQEFVKARSYRFLHRLRERA